ncbi:polysaccharide deacetylase family protein [Desulforamulus aquiferis]|uniref:Polysaccharide deacetylase family protein n=1 Tax=Desulforamulus aquiferis TaxID=1397668 RepID=A0AAW7ZDV0_9FIRM|nr:polysaccharide deacetylase family protein [Desulforamulus aquiferis]MDO7787481.1 polysaccharide deacetylase family protein [Desulforamulus aquiferis]
MRIFYFGKRTILKALMLLAIITVVISLAWVGLREDKPVLAPVYQGNDQEKKIALACNVFWGEEYIPKMLETLAEHKVKVTFFAGGTWVEDFPEILKRMDAAGHEIGTHGYSHPHPDQLSKSGNLRDMHKAEKLIYETINKKPTLYAPPYGERGPAVLKAAEEMGYTFVLWSVDTIDWQRPSPDVIVRRVLGKAHNGAIVLMHPTAPTVAALPQIISHLQRQGYQFVTVGELIENLEKKE